MFGDRTVTDFKMSLYDGKPHLSLILLSSMGEKTKEESGGFILDDSYAIRSKIRMSSPPGMINMHEFNVRNQSQSALMALWRPTYYDNSEFDATQPVGWIGDTGFREVNVDTHEVVFDWKSLDHIKPLESVQSPPKMPGAFYDPWDYLYVS